MRTTPGALASAALLCALVVIACIPQPAAGKSTPPPGTANCQTCGLVASGLEIEFLKLEDPELSQQTGASEAEMAQRCVSSTARVVSSSSVHRRVAPACVECALVAMTRRPPASDPPRVHEWAPGSFFFDVG